MTEIGRWLVCCDGASRGNPGEAAIGCLIVDPDGHVRDRIASRIGRATNNEAEYRAAIAGLEAAQRLGATDIELRLDSELVVRQLEGRYRVRKLELMPLFVRLQQLSQSFRGFAVGHVPRSQNRDADALANAALDGRSAADLGPGKAASESRNGNALPELRGTPKQVAWARAIRSKTLEHIERELAPYRTLRDDKTGEEAAVALEKIKSQRAADWWISRRDKTAREIIEEHMERRP